MKKKKEGRGESLGNQRLFFWYSKSWCRPLATSDHNFYWSNNALQCHAAFYCFIVYFWYMECYIFYCPSCTGCSEGVWCEWLQEGLAAQVFARAQVCRGGSAHRVLPWLCFTLYCTDRLIRNPSILVSLPCSPGSHGCPCVIFLSLVDLWGFLWFSCTGSSGVSVLSVCPVEHVTEEDHFPSHLLLRSKRNAAFSKWSLKAWKSLTTKLKTQSKRFSNAQELERSVAFISGMEREVLSIWLRQSGVGSQGRSWKITQWEGAVRELQNSCHVSFALFILGTDAVRQREGEWVSMYFCCCLCICAHMSEGVTCGVPV